MDDVVVGPDDQAGQVQGCNLGLGHTGMTCRDIAQNLCKFARIRAIRIAQDRGQVVRAVPCQALPGGTSTKRRRRVGGGHAGQQPRHFGNRLHVVRGGGKAPGRADQDQRPDAVGVMAGQIQRDGGPHGDTCRDKGFAIAGRFQDIFRKPRNGKGSLRPQRRTVMSSTRIGHPAKAGPLGPVLRNLIRPPAKPVLKHDDAGHDGGPRGNKPGMRCIIARCPRQSRAATFRSLPGRRRRGRRRRSRIPPRPRSSR